MHLAPLRTAATVSPEPSSVRLDLTHRHHHWPAGLLHVLVHALEPVHAHSNVPFGWVRRGKPAACAPASLAVAARPHIAALVVPTAGAPFIAGDLPTGVPAWARDVAS